MWNWFQVTKIILKKGYDYRNFNNDIALIQIIPSARHFDENDIKVSDSPPDPNVTAIVIGWGATSDGKLHLNYFIYLS